MVGGLAGRPARCPGPSEGPGRSPQPETTLDGLSLKMT